MRGLVGRSSEDSQNRQFPGVDNVAAKMLKIESETTKPLRVPCQKIWEKNWPKKWIQSPVQTLSKKGNIFNSAKIIEKST